MLELESFGTVEIRVCPLGQEDMNGQNHTRTYINCHSPRQTRARRLSWGIFSWPRRPPGTYPWSETRRMRRDGFRPAGAEGGDARLEERGTSEKRNGRDSPEHRESRREERPARKAEARSGRPRARLRTLAFAPGEAGRQQGFVADSDHVFKNSA